MKVIGCHGYEVTEKSHPSVLTSVCLVEDLYIYKSYIRLIHIYIYRNPLLDMINQFDFSQENQVYRRKSKQLEIICLIINEHA